MRSSRRSSAFSLTILCLFVTGFLLSTAIAQGNLPQLTGSTNNAIPTASSPAAPSASSSASDATSAAAPSSKSDQSSASSAAVSTSPSNAATSTSKDSASSKVTPPPKITSSTPSASADTAGLPSGLPSLTGAYNYPAPTVPPTKNAPFMQKSNLPEGTIFIAVGSALAFFGLSVLAWRGLVAWSLHRSVKRAAMQHHYGDTKSMLRGPGGGFYSHGPGSTLSLEQLGASGRSNTQRSKTHNSNLFFSPTAGAGMHTSGNRGSSYLPAGYYAAGNSAPGGGSGMSHIGGGPISLSNLGPQSHRYSRARSLGPSPPGSPALPPSRGADVGYGRSSVAGLSTHPSTSTLNLSVPPQGRTPSAYLEDLFGNPPAPTAPSTDRRH